MDESYCANANGRLTAGTALKAVLCLRQSGLTRDFLPPEAPCGSYPARWIDPVFLWNILDK